MSEIVLFHSALGLRPGIHWFADLPECDEQATELVIERTLVFLSGGG